MKLSTGKIAFPLQFDNGDVENIMINPHDSRLYERIKNFESSIQERIKKIDFEKYKDSFSDKFDVEDINFEKLMDMSGDELSAIAKQTDVMVKIDKELETELCNEIDDIFDDEVSKKAFKYVPPLAMIPTEGGDYEMYILQVLRALAIEVQKYGNKMKGAMNKHVAKYRKK